LPSVLTDGQKDGQKGQKGGQKHRQKESQIKTESKHNNHSQLCHMSPQGESLWNASERRPHMGIPARKGCFSTRTGCIFYFFHYQRFLKN
jgi:hypothetical protein